MMFLHILTLKQAQNNKLTKIVKTREAISAQTVDTNVYT